MLNIHKNENGSVAVIFLILIIALLCVIIVMFSPLKNVFKNGTSYSFLPRFETASALSDVYIATSGSDTTGDGSINKPFKTFGKAQSMVGPGSTVYVRGGTYNEKIIISTGSGSASSVAMYKPYNGESVTLDGTGISLTPTQGLVTLYGVSYITFSGFNITNSSGRGLVVDASNNVLAQNNKIHHTQYQAFLGAGSNITFDSNEVYSAGLSNVNGSFGCGTPGCSNGGWPAIVSTWKKPDGSASQNINITNNKVYNSWGEGIDLIMVDGGSIKDNKVYDNYSVLIYLDHARNITISGNYLYNQNSTFYRNSKPADGILLAAESCCVPNPNFDNENIIIANNLILNTKNALAYWNAGTGRTYRNLKVFYNDIKDSVQNAGYFDSASTSGNEFRDNIVYGNFVTPNASSWAFSNNNWPGGKPSIDSSSTSFSADPQFIGPISSGSYATSAEPYKLMSSSSSINKGIPTIVTNDYFGTTRTSTPTVGFYQYTTVTSPSPTPSPTPTNTPTPTPTATPTPTPSISVSISKPTGTTIKNGSTTIQTTVSNNVTKVEFYVNNQLLCTDTSASFTCNWTVPKGSGVQYTVLAKAFAGTNNNSTSKTYTVK